MILDVVAPRLDLGEAFSRVVGLVATDSLLREAAEA